MRALEEQVKTDGACTLPGVSIAYELFMPIMMRAVARGYVRQEHADFVANGLRFGFDLGVDVSKLATVPQLPDRVGGAGCGDQGHSGAGGAGQVAAAVSL